MNSLMGFSNMGSSRSGCGLVLMELIGTFKVMLKWQYIWFSLGGMVVIGLTRLSSY